MKRPPPHPKISDPEADQKRQVFDDQHPAAYPLRILAVPIYYIGERPACSGGHNQNHCYNTGPEKPTFDFIKYSYKRLFTHMRIMQQCDGRNRRQPDAGCEIMNEPIKNYERFFHNVFPLRISKKL